jgi:two-component system, NarL family, nitrate/nitrite response regulator NarL
MKRHIFLTRRAEEVARWREAFPEAEVVSFSKTSTIFVGGPGEALVWVHLSSDRAFDLITERNESNRNEKPPVIVAIDDRRQDTSPADLVRMAIRIAHGCPVVVLSNQMDQEEGLTCLEAGASGYTNALSNPAVLQQIATVVENGGLWVGPELLARLRNSLARMPSSHLRELDEKFSDLTPREREVALAVAAGASNKEVARTMGITERTVKAHLSAIFNRLGIRDRMQLSLLVNGTGN